MFRKIGSRGARCSSSFAATVEKDKMSGSDNPQAEREAWRFNVGLFFLGRDGQAL
jgi:hypothetical protein